MGCKAFLMSFPRWWPARNRFDGDVAVAAARVALKYEEINLVELRVLSGEKVPRQTLDLLR